MKTMQTRGHVFTFYSFRGGTGRSMALANIACLLATRHEAGNVLMVDWDLEAPGLHRFFQDKLKQLSSSNKEANLLLEEFPGLLDLFYEVENVTRILTPKTDDQAEQVAENALRDISLQKFVLHTDVPSLHLLKAGCFDEGYSERVSSFRWVDLYERLPSFFRLFADKLANQYDYVLIDSRTGLNDTSHICTALMPEKLVVVFTPNRQSISGLDSGLLGIVRRATEYRRRWDDLRPLVVFPLPSRIDRDEINLYEDWRWGNSREGILGYERQFEQVFKEVYGLQKCDLKAYFNDVEIPHVSYVLYGEPLAVLSDVGKSTYGWTIGQGRLWSLTETYERIAHRLADLEFPWEKTDLKGK